MLSREDKYRSTIIDRIIKSLGNGLTSGVYLRTTIDDSSTNDVVISADPNNTTITIANANGSASRTFDYSSGITWSEFNSLFTLTSSIDNVEVNGTSITISDIKVRDEPGNVTPIDWNGFTNITLTNCTFDVKRIDGAFSKSGPVSISIDDTNDFTNVYSFDHLFDGCNTLTTIVFNPIHNGMFTANWMLANLSREMTPHKFQYFDHNGNQRTVVEWTREPFNITLLDFTNCHSALNLLDGTDYVSSITLSSSDFAKQTVGTLLTLGNYSWSVSPIYSKTDPTTTVEFEIHGFTSFWKLVAKLVQEQTGTMDQDAPPSPSLDFEVNLVIENVTIFYYDYEGSYTFEGDSSATETGNIKFYSNNDPYNKVWRTAYPTGFGDTFKSIDVTFKNCNIYSAGMNQSDTLFYPFTSLSFENCYFGPYSLIGNFQFWVLCTSVKFTDCDTSDVIYLRSTFGRYYSLEILDLSRLNFDNVVTAKYICVNDNNTFTYQTPEGTETITHSLTKVIFPSRMPKLRSLQMAFRYCTSLETVIFPSDLSSLSGQTDSFLDKPITVDNIDVYPTQKIVIIPNIDNYGINSKMVNIKLDEDDLYTGLSDTFLNCFSLKYIKFPPMNALRQMYNTFKGCISLQRVEFGDMNSLEVIQDIFDGCIALKSVKFNSCINLEYIYDMFTSVSTLEELEMLNCPNVDRFVNLVPSSVKRLKLEGFNSIVRNYTGGDPTPSLIASDDQITYHNIGSSNNTIYSDYTIFHYAANGYDKLEEIEFIGFNNINTLYLIFTSSMFPRLHKLRLIGFTNCTSCYSLVQFHNTIEDIYMEGFYNIKSLYAAFANTSNLKNVSLILSDNLTIETQEEDPETNIPYELDTQWMCERAVGLEKFVWHGKRFAKIYNDYNPQSIKIAYSFLFYCNSLRYLDLSGMRIFEFKSEYMTNGILAQIIDDSTIPYAWSLQPSHLTTLVVPNLYNIADTSNIEIRNYIPFGYERYKKAIVYSIDSLTTMTCKLSVMGRFFVRQSDDDIPPLDWTIMNITKDNIDYGYFEMDNTSGSITTTTTISVTVSDTSQYSVGDEYKGIGSERVERTGQTTITNSITYPCSIYQTRPNVVWIIGTTSTTSSTNIEEYGFAANNGLTTFPNLRIPDDSSITYYTEYISSNNSPL